jgi:hypothetical protein
LLTGVENGSETAARGFPDSLRREQRFVRSTAAMAGAALTRHVGRLIA